MNLTDVFKYCPRCSAKFNKKEILLECYSCGLHYYLNPKPGTMAVIQNDAGEYMLVKRARSPKKGYWDLPGGFVDLNETYEEGIQREIKEELGVDTESIIYINSVSDTYEYQSVVYPVSVAVFIVKISNKLPIEAADDIAGYEFFKAKDIPIQEVAFPSVRQVLLDITR